MHLLISCKFFSRSFTTLSNINCILFVFFVNSTLLEEHITEFHKSNVFCKAENCTKKYKHAKCLKNHYEKYHQKGSYQCIRCIVVKTTVEELTEHTKNCKGESTGENHINPVRETRNS